MANQEPTGALLCRSPTISIDAPGNHDSSGNLDIAHSSPCPPSTRNPCPNVTSARSSSRRHWWLRAGIFLPRFARRSSSRRDGSSSAGRRSSEARRSSPTTCCTSSRTFRWEWSRPRTTTTASARGCSRPSVTRTRTRLTCPSCSARTATVSLPRLHGDLPAGRAGTRPRRVPVAG